MRFDCTNKMAEAKSGAEMFAILIVKVEGAMEKKVAEVGVM